LRAHLERVVQVPLNLVQNVFRGAPEHDSAGFWVLALCEEGKVLVANLLDLEEAALGADVFLFQLFRPVDNGGANCLCNSVVVCLLYPSDDRNSLLGEEV